MKVINQKFLTTLMIGCYAILTLFVIQWILTQYRNEKSELRIKLGEQFDNVQHEITDAMLEKTLIDPLLKNKKGFKIHVVTDSIHADENGIVKKTIIRNSGPDTTGDFKIEEEIIASADTSNDLLLHGVKLVFKEISGTRGKEFEHHLFSSIDTGLINNHLYDRFHENEWNFKMKWVGIKDTSGISSNKNLFYYKSNIFPLTSFLEVYDYDRYLLLKILPQGIFAVILLLLTGFAFYVSNRALKNQVKLNLLKNELIDNISHELKTPLTTVKVVIDALQDEKIRKDNIKTKEYLEMASLEIDRLELLTGKVLNTSMMENGMMQLQKTEIDLLQFVNKLTGMLDIRMKKSNARIEIENDGSDYKIIGDAFHLEGAFLNIIDNALKYSGENPAIKISFLRDSKNIIVKVSDNGRGIPDEYLEKVFNKFFRVPSENLHNVKGHGLGLSYVSMVMKMHGGRVYAKNEDGAVFNLFFNEAV